VHSSRQWGEGRLQAGVEASLFGSGGGGQVVGAGLIVGPVEVEERRDLRERVACADGSDDGCAGMALVQCCRHPGAVVCPVPAAAGGQSGAVVLCERKSRRHDREADGGEHKLTRSRRMGVFR